MRRSKERLTDIDNYLRNNYPKDGARACAKALNEPIGYITSRAQVLNLVKELPGDKKRRSEAEKKIAILEGKLIAKNNEIKELFKLLKKQKKFNKELRGENLRMINEKVKANVKNNN